MQRSRLTLWLLLAVCAAPIVGSYVAYYFWRPSGYTNYGELVAPRPLPDTPLARLDGGNFRISALKGSWVLLVADVSACDEACRTKLVHTRQVRLAQGKETKRIERVWLVADNGAPDPALLKEQPGLVVVRAGGSDVLAALPAPESATRHMFVVDPLGNVMMRYAGDADPRLMLKDVARLLRHSKWK